MKNEIVEAMIVSAKEILETQLNPLLKSFSKDWNDLQTYSNEFLEAIKTQKVSIAREQMGEAKLKHLMLYADTISGLFKSWTSFPQIIEVLETLQTKLNTLISISLSNETISSKLFESLLKSIQQAIMFFIIKFERFSSSLIRDYKRSFNVICRGSSYERYSGDEHPVSIHPGCLHNEILGRSHKSLTWELSKFSEDRCYANEKVNSMQILSDALEIFKKRTEDFLDESNLENDKNESDLQARLAKLESECLELRSLQQQSFEQGKITRINKFLYFQSLTPKLLEEAAKLGDLDLIIKLLAEPFSQFQNLSLVHLAHCISENDKIKLSERGALLTVIDLENAIEKNIKNPGDWTNRRTLKRLFLGTQSLLTLWKDKSLADEASLFLNKAAIQKLSEFQVNHTLSQKARTLFEKSLEDIYQEIARKWCVGSLEENQTKHIDADIIESLKSRYITDDIIGEQLEINVYRLLVRQHKDANLPNNLTLLVSDSEYLFNSIIKDRRVFMKYQFLKGELSKTISDHFSVDQVIKKLCDEWVENKLEGNVAEDMDLLCGYLIYSKIKESSMGDLHSKVKLNAASMLLDRFREHKLDDLTNIEFKRFVEQLLTAKSVKATTLQKEAAMEMVLLLWKEGKLDDSTVTTEKLLPQWHERLIALNELIFRHGFQKAVQSSISDGLTTGELTRDIAFDIKIK